MNSYRADPQQIREELNGFIARHRLLVSFNDTTNPAHNPLEDDYIVVYEASFEPVELTRAYLKVMVTEEGQIGLGLETRERVACRLGVKPRLQRLAFAAGRELASLHVKELLDFVAIVAKGQFTLHAKLGLTGLGSVKTVVSPQIGETLIARNRVNWDWITVSAKEPTETFRTKVVRFQPWYE